MKWILSGCLFWLIAGAVFSVGIWQFFSHLGEGNRPFLAPTRLAFQVEPGKDNAPQTVKLWLDYNTTYDNRVYHNSGTNGMELKLRDDKGAVINFPISSMVEKMSINGTSRYVVAKTDLQPGQYVLDITGLKEPAVFSLSIGDDLLMMIFGFIGTIFGSGIGGLLGLVLIIVGIVKIVREKKRRAADQAAPIAQE